MDALTKPVEEADLIRSPLLDAWYLTGPTASGKTEIAVWLAKRLEAEVISMDSMAVYRGMDIGTAKPSPTIRMEIPHHLIDIVDPTECYSVSQFVKDAHRIASEIRGRGKQVLLVGGTPLYLKSLLRGMFLGPEADWEFRKQVEEDVEQYGLESLRDRLRQVDPLSAHKLLAGDKRRMIRALEVARLTGRPISHWQSQFETPADPARCKVVALEWERPEIHRRVNARVDGMFDAGFVGEVQELLQINGPLGRTASQAVGYCEVIENLQTGLELKEVVLKVQARTRQFVRRQEIWFRGMEEVQRVAMSEPVDARSIADQIYDRFTN